MAELIVQAISAAYLAWIGLIMKAEGGLASSFIFKVFPLCAGVFLGFHVYARLMGWAI
ncbi:hypothetical protein [Agrobacterium pusense]|uniref:hypothetical protein n=1 Tax=Agrobacterium pusense TaxID=648995 RepID=UPI0013008259|nr:hypothetical protein [Agrobacterium pusense]